MNFADFLASTGKGKATPVPSRSHSGVRTVELFSGAGLATEGLLAAGADMVRCIEWNKDADATARGLGHPSVMGDVRIPQMTAGVGTIDMLWASPPCQAWSQAGRRLGRDDPRNGFPWTLEVVDRLTPRWVMIENVPGLTHHKAGCGRNGRNVTCAGCYFDSVVQNYRDRYASVAWKILNAADYGAPQTRERVFMVAGPTDIVWPKPTHGNPKKGSALPRWRTIRDVIQAPGLDGWCSETNHSAADYRIVKSLDMPINPLAAGSPNSHTGCGFAFTFGYPVGTKVPVGAPRVMGNSEHGIRRPSVDESALLMGMPSGVHWQGNMTAQRQQVGNGCCPQVVRALVESVITANRSGEAMSTRPVAGSRFVASQRAIETNAALHRAMDASTLQLWSTVLPKADKQSSKRAIEALGGHHLEWFDSEEEVEPLASITHSTRGCWQFLLPRTAVPQMRSAGWITQAESDLP